MASTQSELGHAQMGRSSQPTNEPSSKGKLITGFKSTFALFFNHFGHLEGGDTLEERDLENLKARMSEHISSLREILQEMERNGERCDEVDDFCYEVEIFMLDPYRDLEKKVKSLLGLREEIKILIKA